MKNTILKWVIHKVRSLRRGKGGPAKSVVVRMGGKKGKFSCKHKCAVNVFRRLVTKQKQNKVSYSHSQNSTSSP